MFRKFVTFVILFTLIFSFTSFGIADTNKVTYLNEARTLYDLKLFQGISSTSFMPDLEKMSNREQAMKIIAVALQWDLNMNDRSPFTDVSDWAQPYVAKAFSLGITNGISSTKFGALNQVTRKELGTWMLRALGYSSSESWLNTNALSINLGTNISVSNSSEAINRDELVGMLFNYLKTGKELSNSRTLIDEYLVKYPEYTLTASSAGMIGGPNIKIGLATDIGGVNDKSFGELAWNGLKTFATQHNLSTDNYFYEKTPPSGDYYYPLQQLINKNCDLIIAVGFSFSEALNEIASKYPNQKFVIIDSVVDQPNVKSILFKEHEGSYLVGLAAGIKAKEQNESKVGFIGGLDIPLIQKFEAGFIAGVHQIDPNIDVLVNFASTFTDADVAKMLAMDMYNEGAYIIYQAAGPAGQGVIQSAKEQTLIGNESWVIGVDKDQYEDGLYNEVQSVVLTSMLKRIDNVVSDVCSTILNNTFSTNQLNIGLREFGVSLPLVNPNLLDAWSNEIYRYHEQVTSGMIVVPDIPERIY